MLILSFLVLILSFNSALATDWVNTTPASPTEMMVEQNEAAIDNFTSQDKKKFSRLYKKHKRPKFIILFNQELSGDVNDWRANERLVVSNEVQLSLQQAHQRKNKRTQISFPSQWRWQFEQGFVQLFEDLRVRLVDIKTAKRLTASKQMDSSPGLSGMVNSLKKNEIDALSGYADFYIELMIINSQDSDSEYELKARMIDTKTGEIVARVNSSSSSTPSTGGYTGSKNGYSNISKPGISRIANYLAEELIIKINHAWAF
jgi:hypothetical protein